MTIPSNRPDTEGLIERLKEEAGSNRIYTPCDPELVRQAASALSYYLRVEEMAREVVGPFAEAASLQLERRDNEGFAMWRLTMADLRRAVEFSEMLEKTDPPA